MTVARDNPVTQRLTLAEYLSYDNGSDSQRYELWNGELVEMGAESNINVVIGSLLLIIFSQWVPYYCVHRGTEIVVSGKLANTRFPDLLVISKEGAAALSGKSRSMVTLDMPAPILAVEVVSSSRTDKKSRDRDYVDKRREYAQRGISEYWIVDPGSQIILILNLVDGVYRERKFLEEETLASLVFPLLTLNASQILNAEI